MDGWVFWLLVLVLVLVMVMVMFIGESDVMCDSQVK